MLIVEFTRPPAHRKASTTAFVSNMRVRSVLLLLSIALGVSRSGLAQHGSCMPAEAEQYLSANHVRARITNNGNLFWKGAPHVYEVAPYDGVNAIFTAGIWVGGLVEGDLRVAAARYANYEYWPGPLDDDALPPVDCRTYDGIWSVSVDDLRFYDWNGIATNDLSTWPTGLGAPTIDRHGHLIDITDVPFEDRRNRTINLAAGERPKLSGDEMLWWVMNDAGNEHESTGSKPIGLEVQVSAFAFARPGPLQYTTFYRYQLINRAEHTLDSAYVAFFADWDLGNFDDDYVGSDTTLFMGFVYNADNDDEGADGYGKAPPALGIDFVRGPVVPSLGDTARVGADVLAGYRNLDATAFIAYNNGGGNNGDPRSASDYYNYMRARWRDGTHLTFGNRGTTEGNPPTNFMYPAAPETGEYWSEFSACYSGNAMACPPADRRGLLSTGPFTIDAGETQEIVVAIVWARGKDNFDSIVELRRANRAIQAFSDANFRVIRSIDAPIAHATPYVGSVLIDWANPPGSNNYLDTYREFDVSLNATYVLEGYNVYQFRSAADSVGTLLATYDRINDITEVIDGPPDGERYIVARGSDAGIRHSHLVNGLTNGRTYHFGVEAYAFQDEYHPRVMRSRMTRVSVTPGNIHGAFVGTGETGVGDSLIATTVIGTASRAVFARLVNPADVTGASYEVRFSDPIASGGVRDGVTPSDPDAAHSGSAPARCCPFEIVRDDGHVVVPLTDVPEFRVDDPIHYADGLEWYIKPTALGFSDFLAISNAAGNLEPPEYAALAINNWGFPHPSTGQEPTSRQQTNDSRWFVHAGGGQEGPFGSVGARGTFVDRVTNGGATSEFIGVHDYEMRFTARGGLAYRRFNDGAVVNVPFELWRIGVGSADDPSDDVRLIPGLCEFACITGNLADYESTGRRDQIFDIGGDHGASAGDNDPFTDWVYFGLPGDSTAGESGYEAFFEFNGGAGGQWANDTIRRIVLVNWNGGVAPGPYNAPLPETGTTFRIITNKPVRPGDVYRIDTQGYEVEPRNLAETKDALSQIGVVPNPYYGSSVYEVADGSNEVRFTNIPGGATIRVFSLSGSLIRLMRQDLDGVVRWDLRNEVGRRIAGGVYLVHIDVPGVGERVLKFAMVREPRVTLQ